MSKKIKTDLSQVQMMEQDGHHVYTDGTGVAYPSVTTILSTISYNKAIVSWANNLGFRHIRYEEELNRTADEGTFMHAFAQALVDPEHGCIPNIRDPLTQYRVRQRAQGLNFKLKYHEGNWKTIFTEKAFISRTYEIGGTLDWYASWYGKNTLFDFKSSSGLRSKHLLQLGGYDLILQDNGIFIDQAGIILAKRDNCIINIIDRDTLTRCGEIFLKVKDWYYQNQEIETITREKPTIL